MLHMLIWGYDAVMGRLNWFKTGPNVGGDSCGFLGKCLAGLDLHKARWLVRQSVTIAATTVFRSNVRNTEEDAASAWLCRLVARVSPGCLRSPLRGSVHFGIFWLGGISPSAGLVSPTVCVSRCPGLLPEGCRWGLQWALIGTCDEHWQMIDSETEYNHRSWSSTWLRKTQRVGKCTVDMQQCTTLVQVRQLWSLFDCFISLCGQSNQSVRRIRQSGHPWYSNTSPDQYPGSVVVMMTLFHLVGSASSILHLQV